MAFKSFAAALLALGTVACSSQSNPAAPTAALPATLTSAAGASAAPAANASASSDAVLARVRNATARYHDVDAAIADGYMPPEAGECFAVPGLGVMGIHSPNMGLLMDQTVDPLRPEVLLYLPKKGGGFKLIGVEYMVPLSGPNDPLPRPSALGQGFDGPMAGHEPGMPWHYDLHVWAWSPNPAGTFAQFNPRLSCDAVD